MQDRIDLARDENIVRDIMLAKGELLISQKMGDVVAVARDEIVQPDHLVPFGKKAIGQVRAKEPRCSGDQNTHLISSVNLRFDCHFAYAQCPLSA